MLLNKSKSCFPLILNELSREYPIKSWLKDSLAYTTLVSHFSTSPYEFPFIHWRDDRFSNDTQGKTKYKRIIQSGIMIVFCYKNIFTKKAAFFLSLFMIHSIEIYRI